MGCGFSSLKGEDVNNGATSTAETEAPARRVNTNFSTIDYEQDSHGRRMTEYAPHETVKAKPKPKSKPSHDHESTTQRDPSPPQLGRADNDYDNDHAPAAAGLESKPRGSEFNAAATTAGYPHEASRPLEAHTDGEFQLKPYQTLDGGDWDADPTQIQPSARAKAAPTHPHVNGDGVGDGELPTQAQTSPDPTSSLAKDEFATSNDPANPVNQESQQRKKRPKHLGDENDDDDNNTAGERKKSWLGQKFASYQQAKQGRGVQLSDDELKKYTGRNRAELDEWAKSQPGVAGNQSSGRIGADSAMASSAPYAVS